jgi:NAD(P)-dependent dehydrogenase (short-subunit alcohol dehydrogenase family)
MVKQLDGKVAIVTGAGRGIGRGIALELAKDGARVAVTSLHAENAQATTDSITAAGGDAIALGCDVNDKDSIDGMVQSVLERWGTVDALVNNAQGSMGTGETAGRPLEEMTAEHMYANFLGGAVASMWAMQAVFPTMRGNGGGRIVNMSSLNGQVGRMLTTHYNAAKEAVRALTRTAAREWAKYGITVNVVSPTIKSDSVARALEKQPEFGDFLVSGTPLRAIGEPREAGRLIAFLAGDDSRLITGMTFMCDKGRIMSSDARLLRYPDERPAMVGTSDRKWY